MERLHNALKIETPKTETLIDALNFILHKENSDFYLEYGIDSCYRKYQESPIEYVSIKMGIDVRQYSSKEEDNYMIYRDFLEMPKDDFNKRPVEEISALDYRWFYSLLSGTLLIVDNDDSPQHEWPRCRPIKTVSWNTMINTKRDDSNNTNQ